MKRPHFRSFATLCLFVCATVLLTPSSLAGKEGYYRWKDDAGETHFTQQPPLGRQYQFIETRGGASVVSNPSSGDSAGNDDGAKADTAPQRMEVLPPKDPAICSQAKSNLLTLQKNGARIRVTDPDGTARLLNEKEVAEQKQRAQEAIGIHCA